MTVIDALRASLVARLTSAIPRGEGDDPDNSQGGESRPSDCKPGVIDLSGWPMGQGLARDAAAHFEHVTTLRLRATGLSDADAGALFALPLTQLEELDLRGNSVGQRAVAALVRTERPALARLELGDTDVDDEAIDILAQASTLPALTTLGLATAEITTERVAALLSAPNRAALTSLDLAACYLGDDLAHILATPHAPRLRSLAVSRNDLTDAALVELARAPTLRDLDHLDLADNTFDGGLADLLAALAALSTLELTACGLSREALHRAASHLPSRLLALGLGALSIDDDALADLLTVLGSADLRRLDLSDNGLDVGAGAVLAASTALARLESLDLSGNRLGADGVAALTAVVSGDLRSLSLAGNALDDEALHALVESPRCAKLTTLRLENNTFTHLGARGLAESPHVGALGHLDLSGTGIGDRGAIALAAAPLHGLRELSLARCDLGPSGAAALATAPWFSGLVALDLGANNLGDDGVLALAAAVGPALERLTLRKTGLTPHGARVLTASPAPRLARLDVTDNALDAVELFTSVRALSGCLILADRV